MLRLLLLLGSVLLVLGLPTPMAEEVLGHSTIERVETLEADDCCPETGSAVDCCDWDFGACCSVTLAATVPLPAAPVERAELAAVLEARAMKPLHLLRPRDNGPPPKPPPMS